MPTKPQKIKINLGCDKASLKFQNLDINRKKTDLKAYSIGGVTAFITEMRVLLDCTVNTLQ